MNALEEFILERGLSMHGTMNLLQEIGLISDNAVWPADVAASDCPVAVKYLETFQPKL